MIKIPYYETSNTVFSNFSPHTVEYKGVNYMTSEHAFHAAKFADQKIIDEIIAARSPVEAFQLGKKYKAVRRSDWNEIKIGVMREILAAKLAQHTEVREALLATEDEEIIEDSPVDAFWGNAPDGTGQNHVGKIWMQLRSELIRS